MNETNRRLATRGERQSRWSDLPLLWREVGAVLQRPSEPIMEPDCARSHAAPEPPIYAFPNCCAKGALHGDGYDPRAENVECLLHRAESAANQRATFRCWWSGSSQRFS